MTRRIGLAECVIRVASAGVLALLGALFGIPLAFAPGDLPPATAAVAAIPPRALAAYRSAAEGACTGLRWELLAGIGQIESGHGSAGGASVDADGVVSPPILGPDLDGTGVGGNTTPMPSGRWTGSWGVAGPWLQAVGPMQFLPGTFDAWAVDGDGDGVENPHDIDDAAATAAAFLCGGEAEITDERRVLRRYNASDDYVDGVLAAAEGFAASPPLVVASDADIDALLSNPNVMVYADGAGDLRAGRVDYRVVAVLDALAQDHRIVVTSLVSGHPRCAVNGQRHGPSCTVSNHVLGRGADVAVVDGVAVSAAHPSVRVLMDQLTSLPDPYRPDEIGGPIDTGQPGVFTNTYHADHLHIGWDR